MTNSPTHKTMYNSFATKKKTLKELQVKLELMRLKINYDSTTLLALKTRIIMWHMKVKLFQNESFDSEICFKY